MADLIKPGFRILMVDDSEEDIFFVRRALKESGVHKCLHAVDQVSEAIAYLRAEGKYADRQEYPFPNVLLSDLKMPGQNGLDLLRWLRTHPECKVVPTIIFSSSVVESDVHEAHVLGANAFIIKPSSFEELVEVVRATYNFWSRCQTPQPPPGDKCC